MIVDEKPYVISPSFEWRFLSLTEIEGQRKELCALKHRTNLRQEPLTFHLDTTSLQVKENITQGDRYRQVNHTKESLEEARNHPQWNKYVTNRQSRSQKEPDSETSSGGLYPKIFEYKTNKMRKTRMAMIPAVKNRCCCILSGRTTQEELTKARIKVEARAKRGLSESAMPCRYPTCQVTIVTM